MQALREKDIIMTRLLELYRSKVLPELKEELKVSNVHAVPKLEKIIVNAGIGRILQQQPKQLDFLKTAMASITGQQPVITRAKKAISGFKIRQGQIVGLTSTLRGKRMYDFLDKLINTALPRTRDFRGVARKGFDSHGNYTLGIREQIVFPEMAESGVEGIFGLEVSIVTTAKDDAAAYKLLKKFGFPFKD